MNTRIVVPAESPLFDGHLPGLPILPGVAELILVADALARGAGSSALTGVHHVRFRGLVRPGDELDLLVPEGSTRFELRRGAEAISRGELDFDGQVTWTSEGDGRMVKMRAVRDGPPMDALLPHRPPMRLVERVIGESERGAICVARIEASCGFVQGGTAPAIALLEAAAQAAAAWEALRRSRTASGGGPRIGYLVSARNVVLDRATVPVDATLHATVQLDAEAGPVSHYVVSVAVSGQIALRGRVGTYLET